MVQAGIKKIVFFRDYDAQMSKDFLKVCTHIEVVQESPN
jgi:hypothetical protein